MFPNKPMVFGTATLVLVLGTGAVLAYQGGTVAQSRIMPAPTLPPRTAVQGQSTATSEVSDWTAGWPELTSTPDNQPKTKAILAALEKPIAMNFPTDTPLSEVITYIREATKGPELPNGIIIYVDPIGLQDSDKTMADTVAIALEDVPLKTTLDLLLKQLSLYFRVKDGLMIITSSSSEDFVTPFTIMEEKARNGELTREQYRQLIEALKLKRQVETLVDGNSRSEQTMMGAISSVPATTALPAR